MLETCFRAVRSIQVSSKMLAWLDHVLDFTFVDFCHSHIHIPVREASAGTREKKREHIKHEGAGGTW